MTNKSTTERRLTASVIAIIVLSICLAFTTVALVYSTVSVEGSFFSTGRVSIDLNGGKSVINEDEFIFEPGMTVYKDFYIENTGTCDVYYKIYFSNVSGGLADFLEIEITDGDELLYSGTPSELGRADVAAADDILRLGERRELRIYFRFPSDSDNSAQDLFLSFDLAADAVQVKNNENKEFN